MEFFYANFTGCTKCLVSRQFGFRRQCFKNWKQQWYHLQEKIKWEEVSHVKTESSYSKLCQVEYFFSPQQHKNFSLCCYRSTSHLLFFCIMSHWIIKCSKQFLTATVRWQQLVCSGTFISKQVKSENSQQSFFFPPEHSLDSHDCQASLWLLVRCRQFCLIYVVCTAPPLGAICSPECWRWE